MSSFLKICTVYTKDPLQQQTGMDTIRWFSLSKCLSKLNCNVDMVSATCPKKYEFSSTLRVIPIKRVKWEKYDAIKTLYQSTINLVPPHPLIISRLARVVGKTSYRDKNSFREHMANQYKISKLAKIILVNDLWNLKRWINFYGKDQRVYPFPTGCPTHIPKLTISPYPDGRPVAIFLGTVSYKRVIIMLNKIGRRLRDAGWNLVVLGSNKTKFYCSKLYQLDPQVCQILESVPEESTWNYLFHAKVGLALAPGPLLFENESSKLYYYLRAALPVACEERISNSHLITNTGWGSLFAYGEDYEAFRIILNLGSNSSFKNRKPYMIETLLKEHSWDTRAITLKKIIEENLHL